MKDNDNDNDLFPGIAGDLPEILQTEELFSHAEGELQAETTIPVEKQREGLKKVFGIVGNLLFACLLIFMVLLVSSMVQSRLRGGPPQLAGHQIYIVLSGSMSPAFDAGSLAFVRPLDSQSIRVGDVITYHSVGGEDLLVTHRVVRVEQDNGLNFITRGDANDVDDQHPVPAANVVGKVNFALPYGGYIMSFGQSKAGIFSLVIIPGILIIIFELRNLFSLAAEWEAAKVVKRKEESSILFEEKKL